MMEYTCAGCEKPIDLPNCVRVVGQDLYFHTPGLVAGVGTKVNFQTGTISNNPLAACYRAYVVKQWKDGNVVPIQLQFEPIKKLDDIASQ